MAWTALAVIVLALGPSPVAGQAIPDAGGADAESVGDIGPVIATCAACHGADGISVRPGVPNLAGQSRAYLANQLQVFARDDTDSAGGRWLVQRHSSLMKDQSLRLSKAAVDAVAARFSAMACTVPPAPSPALKPAVANRCLVCHDSRLTGRRPLTLVPNLAGQRADYLLGQMAQLRDGGPDPARIHSMMNRQATPISDEEIQALAEWFESLGCLR